MCNDRVRLPLKHNLGLLNNSSRRIDDDSLNCEHVFLRISGNMDEARRRAENYDHHTEVNCVAKHLLILILWAVVVDVRQLHQPPGRAALLV